MKYKVLTNITVDPNDWNKCGDCIFISGGFNHDGIEVCALFDEKLYGLFERLDRCKEITKEKAKNEIIDLSQQ